MMDHDEYFMRLAIETARQGIERFEFPFGCCIAQDSYRYVVTGNHCFTSADPTAHAEITAIREWSRLYGAISLQETVIYSTSEPCLMCLGAINWARIPRIVYGTSLHSCIHHGFGEADINSAALLNTFLHSVSMEGGVLEQACEQLFESWEKKKRLTALFSKQPSKLSTT
ncbi:nucleoside deaminase [Paenibacillus sp. FSL M7-0420]|uniref:nucleoside deaminase n=1 Tax=Paenibacillus sp. FSL M7-0420 TaxID=2921609 RepID=UPI0030F4C023